MHPYHGFRTYVPGSPLAGRTSLAPWRVEATAMTEKIVLIGAGSAVFTRGLLADLIARDWDA